MNNKLKVLKVKTLKEFIKLVDDLNWDYDRMSSSGQETMDKINHILEKFGNPKVVKDRKLEEIKNARI